MRETTIPREQLVEALGQTTKTLLVQLADLRALDGDPGWAAAAVLTTAILQIQDLLASEKQQGQIYHALLRAMIPALAELQDQLERQKEAPG